MFEDDRPAGPVATAIRAKLEAAFAPCQLELYDESAKHRGHAGARPGGESHFRLRLQSAVFDGKTRLERQRLVFAALAVAMQEQIHALSLDLRDSQGN